MKSFVAAIAACLSTAIGCAEQPPPQAPAGAPPAAAPEATAPATFADQVSLGASLYGARCAKCHGAGGEGTKDAPRLVGLSQGALPLNPSPTAKFRKTQFKTVADVADFATRAMPPDAPGSLQPEQYWAILAFDLKANGIDLGAKKLDGALAPTLTIPR
jgi:cytochrome c